MEICFLGLGSILSSLLKKKKKCLLHACVCVQEGNSLETSGRRAGNEIPEGECMLSAGQMALKMV